jgi:hypothetical protein
MGILPMFTGWKTVPLCVSRHAPAAEDLNHYAYLTLRQGTSKLRSRLVILVVLAAGIAAASWELSYHPRPGPVVQPLAFDHKRHTAEDIACKDCHKRVQDSPYATFPKLKQCLLCHLEAKGNHPDEPKIREYAKEGKQIPWVQVNRLPGHVYFTHAAHVKYAKMDCKECHGDMKERTEPVTVSQIERLDMYTCMGCHVENNVSTDCLRCHK